MKKVGLLVLADETTVFPVDQILDILISLILVLYANEEHLSLLHALPTWKPQLVERNRKLHSEFLFQ